MGGGDRADRCPGCCCISTAGPTVGFGMRHHPKSPVHGNLLTRGASEQTARRIGEVRYQPRFGPSCHAAGPTHPFRYINRLFDT
jgi:hypothetical protein